MDGYAPCAMYPTKNKIY